MRGLRWISMSLLSVTLREFKSMFNGVSKVLVRCHYIRRFPEQLSHFGVIAAKNGLGGRCFRPFRARIWLGGRLTPFRNPLYQLASWVDSHFQTNLSKNGRTIAGQMRYPFFSKHIYSLLFLITIKRQIILHDTVIISLLFLRDIMVAVTFFK